MILTQNIWRPDTCECEFIQTFDRSTDPATFVSAQLSRGCDVHPDSSHDTILIENKNKNDLIAKIITLYPEIKPEQLGWSFDADRKITLQVPIVLNDSDIKALQGITNNFQINAELYT